MRPTTPFMVQEMLYGGSNVASPSIGEPISFTRAVMASVSIAFLFALIGAASAFDGVGNGTVTVTAAPNLGPARSGTVTIAGITYTVTQESGCIWQLSALSGAFDIGGGVGSVGVAPSDSACAWTAFSNVGWIVIRSVSVGAVSFAVSKNNGKPARSGSITVAGKSFFVNQAGRK